MTPVTRLSESTRVIEDAGAVPRPARGVLASVDVLFERERARRPGTLFDGALFSVFETSATSLRGCFVSYRWWVAQRLEASLYSELRVRPLAVTGHVRAGGATLFGRRSVRVFDNVGRYELAPSGGVDRASRDSAGEISLARQALREAEEELAIPEGLVKRAAPTLLFEDPALGVLDAIVSIELALSAEELEARLALAPRDEYDELHCVRDDHLGAWLEAHAGRLDPVSAAALRHRRE